MSSLKKLTSEVMSGTEGPSAIIDSYRKLTPESAQHYANSCKTQPAGVSRNVCYWRPYPLTVKRGEGSFLWDLDDNRYIDMLANFTTLVHGNAYPPVQKVVEKELKNGSCWAANNQAQQSLAAQLVERVNGVEQIRFVNSGTEAANLALLLARGITGRHKVLMARFGYHGGLHEFEMGSFNMQGPDTFLAKYGDIEAFKQVLDEHGKDIAAVFVEGVLGAGGMKPAPAEFFIELRKAANRAGALFVIDEVISFRLGRGGQQGNLGVSADLTMFGKLIGGGFPVGAVGGSGELMSALDPAQIKVWHSGTFNANPITMAAGDVAVRELTGERIEQMNVLSNRLKEGLEKSAAKLALPFSVNHSGSLLNIFFIDNPPDDIKQRDDHEIITKFHLACLNHGILIATRGMFVVSTIMTTELIDETIDRAAMAMSDVAEELR